MVCLVSATRLATLTYLLLWNPWANSTEVQTRTFNVRDYGAKGDSRASIEGSMSSGSAMLRCLDCSFSDLDVGKKVYVYGADAAPYALSLGTLIQQVMGPNSARLADPATQSISHALVQIVGTNDTTAILRARRTACNAAMISSTATLFFPTGVYAIDEHIEPCSNLRMTGGGTILQTRLVEGSAAGQGGSVIVFPKSPTGRWCTGATMDAGSNVLRYGSQGDRPCNFSPADVGSRVTVHFAGESYLPLYATIQKFNSNTEVVLDRPAGTTVPITNSGFDKVGESAQIGTTAISNVEIDHLTLMNVSTAYPPGSHLGVGIVAFGSDPSSLKQNIHVHDLTIMTASINCLGGVNGFLDQYWFQDNKLIGCADASMYVAGWNSRGTVSNNTIDNFAFPGLPTEIIGRVLHMGILVKSSSNVTFTNNTIHIRAYQGAIVFGDHLEFRDQIENNTITVVAQSNAVIGIEGNYGSQLRITGNRIECQSQPSAGILFYSNAVNNIEVERNAVRNCTAGIKFDGRGTGMGPTDLKIRANHVVNCRDGVRLESTGGSNLIESNKLTHCSGLPWLVTGSQNGATTYFSTDNVVEGSQGARPNFDTSVRRVSRESNRPK
jgi:hypothetical protein